MRNKIFFDANILIDLINEHNQLNQEITYLFNSVRKHKYLLYCSPTTFAITYFFLGKSIKNKARLNKLAKEFFAEFDFTSENNLIIQSAMNSDFRDLEDALQFFSAKDSEIDIIITKNFFDYEHSSIPVYHPLEFINRFLL